MDERQKVLVSEAFTVLGAYIADTRARHAFETTWENFPTKTMLVVTELAEAIEAHRELHADVIPDLQATALHTDRGLQMAELFQEVRAALAEEFADALIRIFDICTSLDLPLVSQLLQKLETNEGRPILHGKRY